MAFLRNFYRQLALQLEKNFFSQNLLPLCHQPSETSVFQTYSGGGSKVGGGSKASPTAQPAQPAPPPAPPHREGSGCAQEVAVEAVVTSSDSSPFTTVKTAFSCGENTVFQRRKRHLPAWQHTHYAQPLPSLSGRGWGWGCWGGAVGSVWALLPPPTLLPPPLLPLCTKGFQRCWWQSGSKNRKKFFLSEKRFYNSFLVVIIAI